LYAVAGRVTTSRPGPAYWAGLVLGSVAILVDQQQRDAIDAAEVFQVNLAQRNSNAKLLLQLKEQFDQLERVKDTSREEVEVMRRHFDVQVLGEDLRNPIRDCRWVIHLFSP
jgi:hypothetical protein